MSKLVKLLSAYKSKEIPVYLNSISNITNITEEYTKLPYGREYLIKVSIGAKVIITEESLASLKSSKDALELAIRDTKRQVAEEVFGEFRPHIKSIIAALWNRDHDTARELVYKLEEGMFSYE